MGRSEPIVTERTSRATGSGGTESYGSAPPWLWVGHPRLGTCQGNTELAGQVRAVLAHVPLARHELDNAATGTC